MDDQEKVGLGAVAHANYGAFNLTWNALKSRLETMEQHEEATRIFTYIDRAIKGVTVHEIELEDYLTLYDAKQFRKWHEVNRVLLPDETNQWIDATYGRRVRHI